MDTTFPSRRLTAASLVGGSLLMSAGLAATPWETERTTAAYHDALAAQPTRAQVAAVLLYAGFLLLTLAGFGMVAAARRAGGWWTRAGAALAVVGMVTLPGLLVTDAYDLALAQELGRAASVEISDAAQGTALATIMTVPAGLGLMLGTIALTTGLWRARVVAGSGPALVLAGWAVPLAGYSFELTMIGAALFVAGCVVVAAGLTGVATRSPANAPNAPTAAAAPAGTVA